MNLKIGDILQDTADGEVVKILRLVSPYSDKIKCYCKILKPSVMYPLYSKGPVIRTIYIKRWKKLSKIERILYKYE